jgi:methionyl-tRNA synthetase
VAGQRRRGDFYRRWYEGHYCLGCEQFYAQPDLEDGCCPEHGTPTEWVAEQNWFFRLSRYQERIERLLATGELEVIPEVYRNEAIAFVRAGLQDISVSRSVERARGWGLPVPDDPTQVIYVWWDALANYITALDYGTDGHAYRHWWLESDERIHVIGKGIVRFHAVYWPALLLSAGEPLPTKICVHPYLTAGGVKLSKSGGTVVDPFEVAATFGTDALRWWLARDVARTTDTDFTPARLVGRANEDLAEGIGNVVNRIAGMVHSFRGGRLTYHANQGEAIPECADLVERIGRHLEHFDLRSQRRRHHRGSHGPEPLDPGDPALAPGTGRAERRQLCERAAGPRSAIPGRVGKDPGHRPLPHSTTACQPAPSRPGIGHRSPARASSSIRSAHGSRDSDGKRGTRRRGAGPVRNADHPRRL